MVDALPISVQGEILPEKLIVPRLRIRKDWYQNLAPDPTDHSHPDLGTNPDAQDGTRGEKSLQCGYPCYPSMLLLRIRSKPSDPHDMHHNSSMSDICTVQNLSLLYAGPDSINASASYRRRLLSNNMAEERSFRSGHPRALLQAGQHAEAPLACWCIFL